MLVDVAMSLESFYKPELDAAHNRPAAASPSMTVL
jgi:hypothetical protein